MSIAEVLAGQPGRSVKLIARVKRAFDGKSGVSSKGQWTRQDFELEDDTGTIKVEWWHNDLGKNDLTGNLVSLQPDKDGKNCFLKEKEGINGRPPSLVISCSGAGRVTVSDGLASTQGQPAQGQQAGQPIAGAVALRTMPLEDYLATANHVAAFCQYTLQLKEEQAIAAIVNTAMIAVSGGRVSRLAAEEPPVE